MTDEYWDYTTKNGSVFRFPRVDNIDDWGRVKLKDKEAWDLVMEMGAKHERRTTNNLNRDDIVTILGQADFWGVHTNVLRQIQFDLTLPKFKLYDWLAMNLMGRFRGVGEGEIELAHAKMTLRTYVDSFLRAKGEPSKFIEYQRMLDYEVTEPLEIEWTEFSREGLE